MFLIVIFYLLVSLQGIYSIFLMIYAWEDADRLEKEKEVKDYLAPLLSFTAIIPARHETLVIADTLRSLSEIEYPEKLKQTLIICQNDDLETINQVKKTISQICKNNIQLITFSGKPINKPNSLNVGLNHVKNDTVVVFDAEDRPHKQIYNTVNTVMCRENVDVVQSGIQLINYTSHWFSLLNVLEYYFWFKSSLHFYASQSIVPLGGNTVFFKRSYIDKVGGWDNNCLTEDADIGIRLSLSGAKIKVIYEELKSTREETPPNLSSFVRQRTRWDQGFIQVLLKRDWIKLPAFRQKFLAFYILTFPEVQTLFFLLIPISIFSAITLKLPMLVTLLTVFPFCLLILQLVVYNIGLYEFTRSYKFRYSPLMFIKLLLTFYPYQFLLGISAARAVFRVVTHQEKWEKTLHLNAHKNYDK